MEQQDLFVPIEADHLALPVYAILAVHTQGGSIEVRSVPEWKIVVRGEPTFEELVVATAGSNLPAMLATTLWAAIQKVERLPK